MQILSENNALKIQNSPNDLFLRDHIIIITDVFNDLFIFHYYKYHY